MRWLRLFMPLFFLLALLSAQQLGAIHALSHALSEQSEKDKHVPHSTACELCEIYAQLSSALSATVFDFIPPIFSSEAIHHVATNFQSVSILVAVARGPPAFLQQIA